LPTQHRWPRTSAAEKVVSVSTIWRTRARWAAVIFQESGVGARGDEERVDLPIVSL